MNRLEFFDHKVRKVRESCRTPEQKETAARYMELYRKWLDLENRDVPRLKYAFLASALWAVVGIPALILLINFIIEIL